MNDITMCSNRKCTVKYNCYRFMAKPHEYLQSYCLFEGPDRTCKQFWEFKYNENRPTDIEEAIK